MMAGKQRRSIGFHVGLYFFIIPVICTLLLTLVFGLFLLRRNARDIQAQKDELTQQARVMANELDTLLRLDKPATNVSEETRANRTGILLGAEGRLIKAVPVLADEAGQVLEPRPLNLEQRTPINVPEEARVDGERKLTELDLEGWGRVAVVGVPLRVSGTDYYALYVFKRIVDFNRGINQGLLVYLLIAASIALFISLALGALLSRKISRPVTELTLAARDIAHGQLDKRVEVEGDREIAELSDTFNYMTGRVQESIELQRDFVANVSHELRTPLTSIEGFSQALLDSVVQDDAQRSRYLEIINAECQRAARILRDLLALSRLDAGEVSLHPSPLPIPAFLDEVRQRFTTPAAEKGVELAVDAPPSLPVIQVDRDRLEQVLINLVDNALKFTAAGGQISVSAHPESAGRVVFEVKDTGAGIPPGDLPHIFDRFFRVERSRAQQFGGSGLGLSICKLLVETMGGSIGVQSIQGSGTAFTVNLPI
jgi:signal transduction histidine kinase